MNGFQFELRCGVSSAPDLIDSRRPPDIVTAAGVQLFWSGHLDHSQSLCRRLSVPSGTCDAALAAALLERDGEAALAQLTGRWALAWISNSGECFAARDPMGGRSLFWTEFSGGIVVATDWEPLFADRRWDRRHDAETLAAFFSVYLSPATGATFYKDLHLVPPGTVVQLTPTVSKPRSFWQPPADSAWRGSAPDADFRYRDLIRQAVKSSVANANSPALLLSSGLDSSSIAAIAADAEIPLRSLSWSVESVPAVDESKWIREFAVALGLQWDLTPADGIWPLHQVASYQPSALGPLSPALGGLRRRLYERAAELDADVVLTGDSADLLFLGTEGWLRGLLADGQWAAAIHGLQAEWRAGRLRLSMKDLAKNWLPPSLTGWRRREASPWLTAAAKELVAERFAALRDGGAARRLRGLQSGWLDLHEAALAPEFSRMGLRVVHPFRDQRLVEFFLALPAHLLYRPGEPKRLARRAMAGVLPESTRTAPRRGTLLPLARRLLSDSLPLVRDILGSEQRDWHHWVRQDWMEEALVRLPQSGRDGAAWLVVWRCVVYELWKKRWRVNSHELPPVMNPITARGHQ